MEQKPGTFFWLIMLLVIFPVVDGIAPPLTSLRAGGNCGEGGPLAILILMIGISSLSYVFRKIRLYKGMS